MDRETSVGCVHLGVTLLPRPNDIISITYIVHAGPGPSAHVPSRQPSLELSAFAGKQGAEQTLSTKHLVFAILLPPHCPPPMTLLVQPRPVHQEPPLPGEPPRTLPVSFVSYKRRSPAS